MPISLRTRQNAWSTLTAAIEGEKVNALAEAMAARQKAITVNDQWSESYKREQLDAERTKAREQAEALAAEVDGARQTLRTAAEELAQPTGDPTAQLLAETRQERAWQRVRPLLDNGRAWHKVIAEAEKARDAMLLVALAAELPSYLEAKSSPRDPISQHDVRQRIDLATARALGDDQGYGTAAQLRLFEAAAGQLADVRLQTVRTAGMGVPVGLSNAITAHYAQGEYERIRAEMEGAEGAEAGGVA